MEDALSGLVVFLILGLGVELYYHRATILRWSFYVLIAAIIVAVGILIWKKVEKKKKLQRIGDVLNKIKQQGLEEDVKNFIKQFGSGLVDKNIEWKYGECGFTYKRLDYFKDFLKRKGIALEDSDLWIILQDYIDEIGRDFTDKMITTPVSKKFDELDGGGFEDLLGRLFVKMGYTVTHTGHTGDQGVDLVAVKDNDKLAIQAKRYIDESVGNAAVQQVFSGKDMYGCNGAVIITTSTNFTREAVEAAKAHGVGLINRALLQERLLQYLSESWN